MSTEEVKALLEKYTKGETTDAENALLETWYIKHHHKPLLDLNEDKIEQDLNEVFNYLPKNQRVTNLWYRISAAASIILCLSLIGYFVTQNHTNTTVRKQKFAYHQDIAPGGNKAMLTLSDGSTIVLNSTNNGTLANQGNITIRKNKDGQIIYDLRNNNNTPPINAFNIATTPRGGQFQLVLSDGTKVWLNAASSIKYPVAFNGNERKVELSGEAYFEVAHNKEKPFRVVSNGQTVEVLGTHFNINSYNNNEAVKTTLLEGSVRILSGNKKELLKPGEQAQLQNGGFRIESVDVDEVIAWKKGIFQFKDDNIVDIMKQLSRWYDVDVKYDGNIPDRKFSGSISRNVNASQILDILSFENIHFRIEGKTIIVMP